MLRAILKKSWRQHPTRHQLYGHLPSITKTTQVRRTRHAGHCWRSRDELISDVLLWTPTYGRAKAGRPARTYIQQLCEDTGCSPEDLPEAMNDREKWRERVRDIRASGTTWWWWWYVICIYLLFYNVYIYIYVCVCVCVCVCALSCPSMILHMSAFCNHLIYIWGDNAHMDKPIHTCTHTQKLHTHAHAHTRMRSHTEIPEAQCLLSNSTGCLQLPFDLVEEENL